MHGTPAWSGNARRELYKYDVIALMQGASLPSPKPSAVSRRPSAHAFDTPGRKSYNDRDGIRRPDDRDGDEIGRVSRKSPTTARDETGTERSDRKKGYDEVFGRFVDRPRRAVVVTITDKGEETLEIESNAEKAHPARGRFAPRRRSSRRPSRPTTAASGNTPGAGPLLRPGGRARQERESGADSRPGEAKGELKRRIEQGPGHGRVVGVETADKMTRHQIAARVRQRFADRTSRRGETE